MIEGRRREVDAASPAHDLRQLGGGGPFDKTQVAARGQQDVDLHATQGGNPQCVDKRCVGQEIRCDDPDGSRRLRQSAQDGDEQRLVILVGTIGNAAGEHRARRRERREPGGAGEVFPGREWPSGSGGFYYVTRYPAAPAGVPSLGRSARLEAEGATRLGGVAVAEG